MNHATAQHVVDLHSQIASVDRWIADTRAAKELSIRCDGNGVLTLDGKSFYFPALRAFAVGVLLARRRNFAKRLRALGGTPAQEP